MSIPARYSGLCIECGDLVSVPAFVRHLRDCELLRARAEAEVDRG